MVKNCENCKFFLLEDIGIYDGECHRYPPNPFRDGFVYPFVGLTDWCGEFKPEENDNG